MKEEKKEEEFDLDKLKKEIEKTIEEDSRKEIKEKKERDQKEIQKSEGVIVFDKHRVIVTTNTPDLPKEKRKIITTRDLPSTLPNYHGIKGEEKNE